MDDYPISCFTAAFRTTLGGVLAFFLGLVGGSYIFLSPDITFLGTWAWLLTAWLVLIPYTIARLWGLLLVPILAVLFVGSIWREWNRGIICSLVAILLSTSCFISAKHNPLIDQHSRTSFLLSMGTAVLVLVVSILWELSKWKSSERMIVHTTPQKLSHFASPEPCDKSGDVNDCHSSR